LSQHWDNLVLGDFEGSTFLGNPIVYDITTLYLLSITYPCCVKLANQTWFSLLNHFLSDQDSFGNLGLNVSKFWSIEKKSLKNKSPQCCVALINTSLYNVITYSFEKHTMKALIMHSKYLWEHLMKSIFYNINTRK